MLQGVDKFYIAGSDKLDYDALDDLRIFLREMPKSQLHTLEDHRDYILLVSKFRTLIEKVTKQNGDRFLETIKKILSVGEDGLYTNRMRFLFELIQNVDDCDYDDGSEPHLAIDFDIENKRLVFRYNESGFTPANVFLITGIAEEAKNTDDKKLQIGEKGIGFKSVFGVANSVRIRSGKFSFSLDRDHFTIPIPEYDSGFSGIQGTELTLQFDSDVGLIDVKNTIMERYRKDGALFTQNPIVFLNKLMGLDFSSGNERLLSFSVSRPTAKKAPGCDLRVSKGMTLTLHRKGRPDRPITGTCYTTTVRYTREDCRSRYGMDTKLTEREMRIEAFFPDESYVLTESGRGAIERGLMYSFLPTQIELEVPIICHAPFKLDASREYVDSQYGNLWFQKTIVALKDFIYKCYGLHAKEVREKLIAYVPKYSKNFFAWRNNSKLEELLKSKYALDGEAIGREKIFYCQDGEFYSAKEVVSFVRCEEIESPLEVLRLCGENRPYFSSPVGFYPGGYNIQCIEEPYERLFSVAFSSASLSYNDVKMAVDLVKEKKPQLIHDACREVGFDELNEYHLEALSAIGELKVLVEAMVQRIKRRIGSNIRFRRMSGYQRSVFELLDDGDSVSYDDMGESSAYYFKEVQGCCLVLNEVGGKGFYFPADNVCVVAGDDPASKIIELCGKLDSDSLFSVRLKLKKASAALDAAMTTEDPHFFLNELRNIRMASRDAMGARAYKSYLDLIQKSGSAAGRYINEIIQNADDCVYPPGEIPTLSITSAPGRVSVVTNEEGFRACNVRAITAIGESTKNLLLSGTEGRRSIGEKGVGFKTIFAIADSVEIHSSGFHFILNADLPTIPVVVKGTPTQSGTSMVLNMKEGAQLPVLDENTVLELCVCLRILKRINLNGYEVRIEDEGDYLRRVTINQNVYEFLLNEHAFEIHNIRALAKRNLGGKSISPQQKIRCYVPREIRRYEYPLYCGLPIQASTCSPMIIDAPFELTTSRDAVLEESAWNKIVLDHVYASIIEMAEMIKDQLGINVLLLFGIEKAETKCDVLYYKAKMFKGTGEGFLNNASNFIDEVRNAYIIPVKGFNEPFYTPQGYRLRIFPDFLSKKYDEKQGIDCPFIRVDFTGGRNLEHLRNVLEALKVPRLKESEFWESVDGLGALQELMQSPDFRKGLYSFLRNAKNNDLSYSREIVPVVTENGTKYVAADDGNFFYSDERRVSTEKYYILDTEILDRNAFASIFGEDLKEMNDAQEREFYCDRICKFLYDHDEKENYAFLLNELKGHNSENLQLCMPTIKHRCRHRIPLKSLNGRISCEQMFVGKKGDIPFKGALLNLIVVNKECADLAVLLECNDIHSITYRNLPEDPWEISSQDVCDIKAAKIEDSDDLLLLAVKNGRVSEEVAVEHGITTGLTSEVTEQFQFPFEPIKDHDRLKKHIQELLANPVKIVSKQVLRSVDYCVTPQGEEFELNSREARQAALRRYSPFGRTDVCFCQMCLKSKRTSLIEVNSIEKRPKLFLPEMRLSLCLECSKKFELLRNQKGFVEDLVSKILRFSPRNQSDNILLRMPLKGNEIFEITFTRTHFAEIQEILKNRK